MSKIVWEKDKMNSALFGKGDRQSMSIKDYLEKELGRREYRNLPKTLREKIERVDSLPPAPRQITPQRLEKALR